MTMYNPNRFVTGTSDIAYVKAVNLVETQTRPGVVTVLRPAAPALVVKAPPVKADTFVKDTFRPDVNGALNPAEE